MKPDVKREDFSLVELYDKVNDCHNMLHIVKVNLCAFWCERFENTGAFPSSASDYYTMGQQLWLINDLLCRVDNNLGVLVGEDDYFSRNEQNDILEMKELYAAWETAMEERRSKLNEI